VAALAALLARLVDRRAAAYGMIALSTTPLYLVEARTMLGDAASMAAEAVASCGLALAVFDRRASARARRVWLTVGLAGLVAGGLSRGALVGVAVPALGVALAWLAERAPPQAQGGPDRLADATAMLALATGLGAAVVASRGAAISSTHPFFDAVIHRVGHGLFPWSAVLPAAFVALVAGGDRGRGDDAARSVVLATSVTAFAAQAVGLDDHPAVPFSSPAAIAIAARDLDRVGVPRGAPLLAGLRDRTASRVALLSGALFVLLLGHDLQLEPARALASVAPLRAGATFSGSRSLLAATVVFATVTALAPFSAETRGAPREGHVDRYRAWPRVVLELWGGRLGTAVVAVEATFVSTALAALRPRALPMSDLARTGALWAWLLFPIALVGVVWVPLFARDAVDALRRLAKLPLGATIVAAGGLSGATLAWGHYPALLGHLSPRAALAAYVVRHAPGEPLAALGVSDRSAAFEVGAPIRVLTSSAGPPLERRAPRAPALPDAVLAGGRRRGRPLRPRARRQLHPRRVRPPLRDRAACDGKGRLPIKQGPHDADNRVIGGTLHVR
jgi:hypothetical protein